jgi:alpha-beta hydrolase superfamily lysophospholipase
VALIIGGSGPTDRDGNSGLVPGKNNSLKLLAEGLRLQGIATVRYDKRGVGASAQALKNGETSLRFDTLVDDAAAWLTHLQAEPCFSRLASVGHSEGSLIGLLAARRVELDGVVSIAGCGRPGAMILRDQLRPRLSAAVWEESESILARLEAGHMTSAVPAYLALLYRESVQPYLVSWLRYDPAREAARLKVPLLIAHGSTDMQISVQEAQLLKAAQPGAELVLVGGMNHILKPVPQDPAAQVASYSDPDLPVVPELIEAIARFLNRLPQAAERFTRPGVQS